jgi:hypothetical protein
LTLRSSNWIDVLSLLSAGWLGLACWLRSNRLASLRLRRLRRTYEPY